MKIRKPLSRIICFALISVMLFSILSIFTYAVPQDETPKIELNCKSALLMEPKTGLILYEKNADEAFAPASVTKIMTLILVMEAIESGAIKYTDMVSTSANAASMGGSQVYLEEGEQMTVDDLLKSVVISSANDAAVSLAEYIAGTEETFVDRMNKRAEQLQMINTHFENTNGLDDTVTNHVTSARDIALMSRELIKHRKILEYSSIWMDTIRNGAFGLTNTNRLIRFYKGATGLKTGSTSKAGFCISATAQRGDMELIAVIMGSPTRDVRNEAAKTLLDYGFANYSVYHKTGEEIKDITIAGGVNEKFDAYYNDFYCVLPRGDANNVDFKIEMNEALHAPLQEGEKVGSVKFISHGKEIGQTDIMSLKEVPKISFWQFFTKMFARFLTV